MHGAVKFIGALIVITLLITSAAYFIQLIRGFVLLTLDWQWYG